VVLVTATVLWDTGWSLWLANGYRVVLCEITCPKIVSL
jgi:hypothetical protein